MDADLGPAFSDLHNCLEQLAFADFREMVNHICWDTVIGDLVGEPVSAVNPSPNEKYGLHVIERFAHLDQPGNAHGYKRKI
jgi:hypothetical protein